MGYKNNKAWRKSHPVLWQKTKRRYYRQFLKNAHNGNQPWSVKDNVVVLGRQIIDRDISTLIGRSVGAIQSQRGRMKKIIKLLENAGVEPTARIYLAATFRIASKKQLEKIGILL